jgi:hypothetical protein
MIKTNNFNPISDLKIDRAEPQVIKIIKIPESGTPVAYKLFVKG